ncbi:hypothetical protein B0H17DRAFT_1125665 [Mycena rosella]|uniref:Uncharacterized protein n=1 Tax=Mycena rosella TaxID=1033263 RepID=A0AAD7GWW0_MYCRO|nr:hypothetical protein B0H17DRAFT_1125665 [Mycena rosella]
MNRLGRGVATYERRLRGYRVEARREAGYEMPLGDAGSRTRIGGAAGVGVVGKSFARSRNYNIIERPRRAFGRACPDARAGAEMWFDRGLGLSIEYYIERGTRCDKIGIWHTTAYLTFRSKRARGRAARNGIRNQSGVGVVSGSGSGQRGGGGGGGRPLEDGPGHGLGLGEDSVTRTRTQTRTRTRARVQIIEADTRAVWSPGAGRRDSLCRYVVMRGWEVMRVEGQRVSRAKRQLAGKSRWTLTIRDARRGSGPARKRKRTVAILMYERIVRDIDSRGGSSRSSIRREEALG